MLYFSPSFRHPITKWAQRKDRVFIEIPLMDLINERVDLSADKLGFSGESGQKKYALDL
jgi:hypothetical protein